MTRLWGVASVLVPGWEYSQCVTLCVRSPAAVLFQKKQQSYISICYNHSRCTQSEGTGVIYDRVPGSVGPTLLSETREGSAHHRGGPPYLFSTTSKGQPCFLILQLFAARAGAADFLTRTIELCRGHGHGHGNSVAA